MRQEKINFNKSNPYNPTIIHSDCVNVLKKEKEGSIDLIIADPPYFKVINEKWDYKWKNEKDYLDWSEEWISEAHRVLRYGGAFYIFGYFRTLSKLVERCENIGFSLRQQIILNKGIRSIAGRKTSTYKMFPNCTESILYFYKDNRSFIKPLFKNKAKELGLTAKNINEKLGVKSNGGGMWSIYTGNNVCEQFPTENFWNKICKILELEIPYEKVSLTFNIIVGITDIWDDINFYFKNRVHPTQKPYDLIKRIILSSSNKNDIILDPFAGSGVVGIVSRDLERYSVIIESDKSYIDIINSSL